MVALPSNEELPKLCSIPSKFIINSSKERQTPLS